MPRLRFCAALLLLSALLSHGGEVETLALAASPPDTSVKNAETGIFARELVRQALLIAAREELGLRTRDAVLGEAVHAGIDALDVRVQTVAGATLTIQVLRNTAAGPQLLLRKELKLQPAEILQAVEVAELCDGLARRDFPEMLRAAGFKGSARPAGALGLAAEFAEERLASLSTYTNFETLREIHRLQREHGESPATLQALARAYANLSVLTEHHWSEAPKALKARALLYAQRTLTDERPAAALYTRAYVLALIGANGAALEDLEAADKQTSGAPEKRPIWRAMIELAARNDREGLLKAAQAGGVYRDWTQLLSLLGVGSPYSYTSSVQAVDVLLKMNPECEIGWDAAGSIFGLSRDKKAFHALEKFLETTLTRLPQLKNLPPEAAVALQRDGAADVRANAAFAALVERGTLDIQEPSWTVLGRVLQETAFKQVLLNSFGGNRNEQGERFADLYRGLHAGHRHAALADALLLKGDARKDAFMKGLEKTPVTLSPYEPGLLIFANIAVKSGEAGGHGFGRTGQVMGRQADALSRDLIGAFWFAQPKVVWARKLFAVNPRSPEAIGELLKSDPAFAAKHSAEVEKHFASNPTVMAGMAKYLASMGLHDRAFACLKNCMALAPRYETALEMTRSIPQEARLLQEWTVVMDGYVRQEQNKYHKAKICERILQELLPRGDVERALLFGKHGAETEDSGASYQYGNALVAAGRAAEAEAYYMPSFRNDRAWAPVHWFMWCKRTGVGNIAAARAEALEWAAGRGATAEKYDLRLLAGFRLLNDEREKALEAFKKGWANHGDPWCGVHGALLAQALQKSEERDTLLAQVAEKGGAFKNYDTGQLETATVELAKLLQASFKQTPPAPLNPAAVDACIKKAPELERVAVSYWIAKHMDISGQRTQARDYYQRAVSFPEKRRLDYALSQIELKTRPAAEKDTPSPLVPGVKPPRPPDEF